MTSMRAIVDGSPDAVWIESASFVVFLSEGSPLPHSGLHTEVTYERGGKHPKVLTQVSTSESVMSACPNHVLLAYDVLIAVDTNSVEIDGIAVSVAFSLQFALRKDGDGVQMSGFNPNCWEFNGVTDWPENYAWYEVVRAVQSTEGYSSDMKIGIIVDSDLGNLGYYNARQRPIYGEFYLPENVRLVYGSSEVGTTEYAANGVMKYCDGQAKRVIELRKKQQYDALPAGRFRTYKKGVPSGAGPTSDSTP